jgi:D-tyrosyl-tRNA(Tyr) deacylase
MRVVIQRVSKASVVIEHLPAGKAGKTVSSIQHGMLILVGIEDADVYEDVEWLMGKILQLRIFNDENGIMNKNIIETKGEIIVVSQFTLHASTKKGNRPSYMKAAKPEKAIPLYEKLISLLKMSVPVQTGVFGAHMEVSLVNDGPVTIIIDSKNKE